MNLIYNVTYHSEINPIETVCFVLHLCTFKMPIFLEIFRPLTNGCKYFLSTFNLL